LQLIKSFGRLKKKKDREHIIQMVEKYVDALLGDKK